MTADYRELVQALRVCDQWKERVAAADAIEALVAELRKEQLRWANAWEKYEAAEVKARKYEKALRFYAAEWPAVVLQKIDKYASIIQTTPPPELVKDKGCLVRNALQGGIND